jgi:hypothetical protein
MIGVVILAPSSNGCKGRGTESAEEVERDRPDSDAARPERCSRDDASDHEVDSL